MELKQIILILLIAGVLFIILYPTNKEGMSNTGDKPLTVKEIEMMNELLDKYNKESQEICDVCLTQLQNMNLPNLSKMIESEKKLSSCALIDKLSGSNQNLKVFEIINVCYGKKYGALLNIISTIKLSGSYKNNPSFATYIDNLTKNLSVIGNNDTAYSIKQYITAMETVNQVNEYSNTEEEKPEEKPKEKTA